MCPEIHKSCWSEDTWKSWPNWKTLQLLLMQPLANLLKSVNPADLKIHQNKDQNGNHSVALIRKEWHFGLKNHEGKHKIRLLGMSHWPDSLQLGEPTRCFHSWIFCALVAVVACYVLSPNIVEPFEYVFPKRSTCHYKKFSKNHQCGFIHAFKHLMLSICSYIESSWMDYLQCGFFHVSSNGLMLNIFCHWEQLNGSSPVWVLSCLFKWLDIEQL